MNLSETVQLRRQALQRVKRVVVKVGTRLLTGESRIAAVMDGIARLRKNGYEVILVSSGAVGLGMKRLNLKRRPPQLPMKQALAAVGQSELMRLYAQYASQYGFEVSQLLLTVYDLRNRESHTNIMACLEALLHRGVLPVINENDSVATRELRVGDNDTLSALIGAMTRAELTILLTTVNGLWKAEDGKFTERISVVRELSSDILSFASGSDDTAMSVGGMRTKLDAAQIIMNVGDALVIADGREENILERIFNAEDTGTLFMPENHKMLSSKKRWIRYFTPKCGALIINAGAEETLRLKHASLLTAGVMAVQGSFDAGETVDILNASFERIAVGVSRLGMSDCASLCAAGRYAPHRTVTKDPVVVHCDELVWL